MFYFLLSVKILFMYLFTNKFWKAEPEKERKLQSSILWFTLKMTTIFSSQPDWSQQSGSSSWSATECFAAKLAGSWLGRRGALWGTDIAYRSLIYWTTILASNSTILNGTNCFFLPKEHTGCSLDFALSKSRHSSFEKQNDVIGYFYS